MTTDTHEEVLRTNRAVREWADGLRDRGRRARATSRRRREARQQPGPGALCPGARELLVPDLRDSKRGMDDVPSLGEVSVVELSRILVEQHGFAPAEAAAALVVGVACSGYPIDARVVVAADALAIVHQALRGRRG